MYKIIQQAVSPLWMEGKIDNLRANLKLLTDIVEREQPLIEADMGNVETVYGTLTKVAFDSFELPVEDTKVAMANAAMEAVDKWNYPGISSFLEISIDDDSAIVVGSLIYREPSPDGYSFIGVKYVVNASGLACVVNALRHTNADIRQLTDTLKEVERSLASGDSLMNIALIKRINLIILHTDEYRRHVSNLNEMASFIEGRPRVHF